MKQYFRKKIKQLGLCGVALLFGNFGFSQEGVKAKINKEILTTYNVKKISVINSEWNEFSPSLSGSTLYFVCDQNTNMLNVGENRWKKKKFVSIFSSQITIPAQDSVLFSKPSLVKEPFYSPNHNGPVCFSKDGKFAILSQDLKEYGHVNKPKLYMVENIDGEWKNKVLLPFVNDEYIFSHPALSDDEQTLFFVSDMPGGKGGKDIYSVTKDGNTWGTPVALGAEVNTDKDEMFPFYKDGVLYYSSNGHGTMGGLDLFKAEQMKSGNWKKGVSLGNTINTTADDFGFILDKEGRSGFFASNREGGIGNDDIYYCKVIETITMITQDIEGRFNYKKLTTGSVKGMEVMLYDDAGNFIGKVTTDDDGYFRFKNLPLDKGFILKTEENGNELTLTILDNEGEPSAFLLSDKNGAFIYKKLNLNYTGSLALMEVEDTEMGKRGKVSGQFKYDRLDLGSANGLNVYLVDDEGNIVMKTKTDKFGNFEFRNLPLESNYMIKTDANSDEMILYIFNKENEVIAQLRKNENGEFLFRKLDPNYASISLMEAEDTEKLAPKSNNIEGDFYYTKLKGNPSNMEFMITDDNGNVLYKGKTDAKGKFFVSNLPVANSYLFRIDENDPNFSKDIELNISSRSNVSIAKLVKDENGNFVYKRLAISETSIQITENTDFDFTAKPATIYFDLNSSVLSNDEKEKLTTVVEILKKDKSLKIVINGHTDSRADETYNNWLSQKRANAVKSFLSGKGISSSQIKTNAFGESMLVNKCGNDTDCSDEQHKMNRRVELNFQK